VLKLVFFEEVFFGDFGTEKIYQNDSNHGQADWQIHLAEFEDAADGSENDD
jgi:hypothetical protein